VRGSCPLSAPRSASASKHQRDQRRTAGPSAPAEAVGRDDTSRVGELLGRDDKSWVGELLGWDDRSRAGELLGRDDKSWVGELLDRDDKSGLSVVDAGGADASRRRGVSGVQF